METVNLKKILEEVSLDWKEDVIKDVQNLVIPETISPFENANVALSKKGDDVICSVSSAIVSG